MSIKLPTIIMENRFKLVREQFLQITSLTEDHNLKEYLAVFGIFLESLKPIISLQDFQDYLKILSEINKGTYLAANIFIQDLPHSFCNDQYESSRYLEDIINQHSKEITLALTKAIFQACGRENEKRTM